MKTENDHLIPDLAQVVTECAPEVVQHDIQHELKELPVNAAGVVIPRDLCDFISCYTEFLKRVFPRLRQLPRVRLWAT